MLACTAITVFYLKSCNLQTPGLGLSLRANANYFKSNYLGCLKNNF